MNELYGIITLLTCFAGVLIFYKLFDKTGLFVWLSIATIIANIQAVKLVNVFGIETALGTILYSTTCLATDILNEKYGKKEAGKAVYYGFACMITMTILMCIALLYKPSTSDFASESLNTIFNLNLRITIASITAFIISQSYDIWVYGKLRERFKSFLTRSKGSTITSQLIDTIIFTTIAYLGLVPFDVLFQIGLTTYIFKFVIAMLDTPFMYMALKIKCKEM